MISVCMAAYNGEKYIRQQINSILCQLGETDELIVGDDCSTDSTVSILNSFADTRIKIIQNAKNIGLNANINKVLSHSKGDYIFLSDQDDFWEQGKVKCMLQALQNVNLVVSDCSVVDENLNVIYPSFFKYNNSKKGFFRNLFIGSYYGCCMAFDRKLLNYSLPIPENKYVWHDLWIGELAELRFKVDFLNHILVKYRRHANTTSCTGRKNDRTIAIKIITRIVFLYKLFVHIFIIKKICKKI